MTTEDAMKHGAMVAAGSAFHAHDGSPVAIAADALGAITRESNARAFPDALIPEVVRGAAEYFRQAAALLDETATELCAERDNNANRDPEPPWRGS